MQQVVLFFAEDVTSPGSGAVYDFSNMILRGWRNPVTDQLPLVTLSDGDTLAGTPPVFEDVIFTFSSTAGPAYTLTTTVPALVVRGVQGLASVSCASGASPLVYVSTGAELDIVLEGTCEIGGAAQALVGGEAGGLVNVSLFGQSYIAASTFAGGAYDVVAAVNPGADPGSIADQPGFTGTFTALALQPLDTGPGNYAGATAAAPAGAIFHAADAPILRYGANSGDGTYNDRRFDCAIFPIVRPQVASTFQTLGPNAAVADAAEGVIVRFAGDNTARSFVVQNRIALSTRNPQAWALLKMPPSGLGYGANAGSVYAGICAYESATGKYVAAYYDPTGALAVETYNGAARVVTLTFAQWGGPPIWGLNFSGGSNANHLGTGVTLGVAWSGDATAQTLADLTTIASVPFAGLFTARPDRWGFIGLNNPGGGQLNHYVIQNMSQLLMGE